MQVVREARGLLQAMQARMRQRDTALIAAGLTFYAGIAVVPALVLSLGLTSWLAGADTVRGLTDRLTEVLPGELGAPGAVERLAEAGTGLDVVGALLTLLPISLYGEGLRRALLRFSPSHDRFTAWRGRLLALPLLVLAPLLLYPLLLVARLLAHLAETPGVATAVGAFAAGYYSVLFALTLPLAWVFRVVAVSRLGWRAVVAGALFTAACLSGFLQGFVLFLALPLDLGAPFGGLTVVGGVIAIGFWLFLLQFVLIAGWLFTQALDERLTRGTPLTS
ncbi:YhjD/YihY/BrkB family envelope integrity protein [Modestobacter sp. VKM Ac-2984]|uniref:YhjD/YihY/BrkB family envelope integrity protein n=1 Tax=Modestobacter sp. VKM Ac-2984 TaxID=3004138 RepID=UPI0022AA2030|nr:YhjD/YihY/BrkB family envelope integrity protein [Modestobacter sp. VKM Ac-2984]MCZ2815735.1 YihY/virulence factor BrkB family protein [Modestobacter sp. VKM Ac-2984]